MGGLCIGAGSHDHNITRAASHLSDLIGQMHIASTRELGDFADSRQIPERSRHFVQKSVETFTKKAFQPLTLLSDGGQLAMDTQSEEEIKSRYENVCGELNLDERSKDLAWEAYSAINNDYVLEVRPRL